MITSLTEYAGFWRRLFAACIDILWIVGLITYLSTYVDNTDYLVLPDQVLATLPMLENFPWQKFLVQGMLPIFLILGLWVKYAATPGKLIVDSEIVDADTGKPIDLQQAMLRSIAYIISLIPLGLGFLWILWDKRKQGWHDKIAGTVVIIHDEATIPLEQLKRYYH
ncbi:RDD family protein [Candidatus Marithrix sp. Canyon 246]|uniref:RDD family protein n=1 Tax=Candidatus Marithrix sp. Canyon 246 TaxID=1827136 RepID=UPI00084A0FC3|nr:RDD family protein [Candidatus Marithrix sp. Canyon 246]